jgi:hypothetical protein
MALERRSLSFARDVSVKETGARRMLSKTIDVGCLKVFCREGRRAWPGQFDIENRLRRSTLKAGYEHVFSDF